MSDEGRIRIAAVGDVMLGDSSHFLGRGVGSHIHREGPHYPWERVKPLLTEADVFFANLESPVSRRPGRGSWEKVYRASPTSLSGLRMGATSVVSVANNHVLEHGDAVLMETRELLEEAGIGCAGFHPSGNPTGAVHRWRQGGIGLVLRAVSLVPDLTRRSVDMEGVEAWLCDGLAGDEEEIRIVSLHWGDEFSQLPSPDQVRLGRRLIECGATLVLGHHPHVLQPIEQVGKGLIAFSLGNFLFDQDWSPATRRGGVLQVEVDWSGVREWKFVPTCLDRGCRPFPAPPPEHAEIMRVITEPVSPKPVAYGSRLAAAQRSHRIRMKLELLRNFHQVNWDTIHFLCTKGRRPRPSLNEERED